MNRWSWALALSAAGMVACAHPSRIAVAPTVPTPKQEVGLVSGDTLAAWLSRGTVRVFDVRPDVFVYLRGHLPQAQYLNTETMRASEGGTPVQLLAASWYTSLFERLGLGGDYPVVIYSAGESADIDATFAAYLIAAAGYPRVYLLDGGWAKWELEHRAIAREYPAVTAQPWPSIRQFKPARVTLDQLERLIEASNITLVDARPPEQFRGDAGSQIRRGHIPAAISHWWADDLERVDFGLVWKSPAVLRAAYAAEGITPDKDIVVYCNSTTEASHVYFALAYLLHYPRVRIYTGSWTEWSAHPELPLATGP